MTLCLVSTTDSCKRDALPHVCAGKPFGIRSYEKCFRKPFRMCSYKIIGLKVSWNEQLQKNRGLPPPLCLCPFTFCLFDCLPTSRWPAFYGISPGEKRRLQHG